MRISLKSLLPVILVSVFTAAQVMADYVSPTSKTNVNQQTDLFKTSIEDLQSLEQQLEDSKTSATQGLEGSPKALEYISDKSKDKLESGVSDLSSIRAGDLADQGRRKMIEDNIIEEIYFDETKPLYIQHKEDADSIAEASSKMLGNLLGMLKELGVDCRTVKGNKVVEPEYFIDLKRTQTKDTVYNKTICEELRNSYNCRDKLTLRCLDFSEKPVKFMITGSTIPYAVTPRGDFTSFSFSSTGQLASTTHSGGGTLTSGFGNKAMAAIGLGMAKSSNSQIDASELGFSFSFNIGCPLVTLSRLELVNINFGSFIALKINGVMIYVGPKEGDSLALAGHHKDVKQGKKKYGGKAGKRATHTTLYPKVSTGSGGEHVLGMGGIADSSSLARIDLKPYVHEGHNSIEIKVIGIGTPFTNFSLNASERICRNWQEDWEETCGIR
jgi:hypothetical protein